MLHSFTNINYNAVYIFSVQPKEKQDKKANISKTYKLPKLPNMPYELQQVYSKLNKMFVDIRIATKIISKSGSCIVMDIVAKTN